MQKAEGLYIGYVCYKAYTDSLWNLEEGNASRMSGGTNLDFDSLPPLRSLSSPSSLLLPAILAYSLLQQAKNSPWNPNSAMLA